MSEYYLCSLNPNAHRWQCLFPFSSMIDQIWDNKKLIPGIPHVNTAHFIYLNFCIWELHLISPWKPEMIVKNRKTTNISKFCKGKRSHTHNNRKKFETLAVVRGNRVLYFWKSQIATSLIISKKEQCTYLEGHLSIICFICSILYPQ